MTREGDDDLYPNDRAAKIEQTAPTIALSLHYNALPDSGDAWNTKGVSTYWYHPQAQNLAVFLHDYLVQKLKRPSYGVYWNNLALTRPAIAPSALIELGFMTNPNEFEWVTDLKSQKQLAIALAKGITAWFHQPSP
jgi:N-acetylmuramoyl-L-alanine amidase